MKRILLILAALSSLASAQSVGEYLLVRKKTTGQESVWLTPGTNNLLSISASGVITPIPKTTYEPALTIGTGITRTGSTLSVNMAALTPPWSGITGTPTTLSGYGITDAISTGGEAGTVANIGNLTGVVTSTNRATSIADAALSIAKTSGLQTALDGKQPLDADLTSIAALATTSYGRSVLTRVDASALRTLQGLGSLATASAVTSAQVSDALAAWTDSNDDGKVAKFGLDGLLQPRFILSTWARADEQQAWGAGCTFEYADATAASNHRAALELDTYFAKTSTPAADGSDEGKLASWSVSGSLTPQSIQFPGGGFISDGSFLFVAPDDPTKESGIAGSNEVGTFINSLPADSGKFLALTTNNNGAVANAETATALATGRTLAITGDLTWTSPSFNGTGNVTAAGTLAASGVTAGSYGSATTSPAFTVDAKGRITAATSTTITPAVGSITGLGTGVATLLSGNSTGTGGPVGSISPTITTPIISSLAGGTAAGDDIIVQGTTNATRTGSHVLLQPNGGLTQVGAGTPIADLALPLQLSTGATGTETNIGINKNGTYGFLLGFKNGSGTNFANYLGGYMRNVTTDPFSIIVNNVNIATTWTSDGSVGLGGTVTNTTTLAGAHLIISGTTGNISIGKTITAGGTTSTQTINKPSGAVNFAAGDTSKVVTNSLCTTSSVIIVTMASNDSTAAGLRVVAGSGSFTIHCATAPAAEMRVNFLLTN